jgi:hypothetical protein
MITLALPPVDLRLAKKGFVRLKPINQPHNLCRETVIRCAVFDAVPPSRVWIVAREKGALRGLSVVPDAMCKVHLQCEFGADVFRVIRWVHNEQLYVELSRRVFCGTDCFRLRMQTPCFHLLGMIPQLSSRMTLASCTHRRVPLKPKIRRSAVTRFPSDSPPRSARRGRQESRPVLGQQIVRPAIAGSAPCSSPARRGDHRHSPAAASKKPSRNAAGRQARQHFRASPPPSVPNILLRARLGHIFARRRKINEN